MMCEICGNRKQCEQEEAQMCIANDYDMFEDDGFHLDDVDLSNKYDSDIDTVKILFRWTIIGSPNKAAKDISNCCSAVTSMIDLELGNLMFQNILRTVEKCHV